MPTYCCRALGRALIAAWTIGTIASHADGSPRTVEQDASSGRLRVQSAPAQTARRYAPSELRWEAGAASTRSLRQSRSTRQSGAVAGLRVGDAVTGHRQQSSSTTLERGAAHSGIQVFDAPNAPESLDSVLAPSQTENVSESSARTTRQGLGNLEIQSRLDSSETRQGLRSRDYDSWLRRQSTPSRLRVSTANAAQENETRVQQLRAHPLPVSTSKDASSASLNEMDVPRYVRAEQGAETLDESARPLRHGETSAKYRLRQSETSMEVARASGVLTTSAASNDSGTATLRATARINEAASTASTLLVLTVENLGQNVVNAPVIRVELPENIHFEAIAFAPPGTGSSVHSSGQRETVDVVVPMRLPSGQARRVMLYLTPRGQVDVEALHVQAMPQGAADAAVREGVGSDAMPYDAAVGVVQGESKDP